MSEGFEIDRAAMVFDGPELPVPEVFEVGAGGPRGRYAISARHHGRFLGDVMPEEAPVVGPALARLLAAFRAVPVPEQAAVEWGPRGVGREPSTWRGWLGDALVDDPLQRVAGWRRTLAADRDLDRLYRRCEARIVELDGACPERRDLVHGDLLNRNVLVADDGSEVAAVFSWKCSVRGDFLYDVAWCTFWGPWHPGIEATDLWSRTLTAPDLTATDLRDAAIRHHAYEVHIGARHLAWNAWIGDERELRLVAAHTAHVLDRGPVDGASR